MKPLILGIALLLLCFAVGRTAANQDAPSQATKTYTLAETIALDDATLKVVQGGSRSIEAFSASGQKNSLVIDLEFQPKESFTSIFLEPSSDSNKSYVVLKAANERIAPLMIATYLPSKVGQKAKVERVSAMQPMEKTGRGLLLWMPNEKAVVSLLFELPEALTASSKELILNYHISSEPALKYRTFVINLGNLPSSK